MSAYAAAKFRPQSRLLTIPSHGPETDETRQAAIEQTAASQGGSRVCWPLWVSSFNRSRPSHPPGRLKLSDGTIALERRNPLPRAATVTYSDLNFAGGVWHLKACRGPVRHSMFPHYRGLQCAYRLLRGSPATPMNLFAPAHPPGAVFKGRQRTRTSGAYAT